MESLKREKPTPFERYRRTKGGWAARARKGGRSVLSVSLHAFTCGMVTAEFGRLMEGGEGDITIATPRGRVLFDTGPHPDCRRDPEGGLGCGLAPCSRSALLRARGSERGSQRSAATRR